MTKKKKELKELAELVKGTFNARMCDLVLYTEENRVYKVRLPIKDLI